MTHTADTEAETNVDNLKDPSNELPEIGAALAVAMAENGPELSKVRRACMIAKEIGQFTSVLDDAREAKHPAHLINAVAALEE
ncbi:hypothetical protein [Tritonibacter mobilis]|uniref:Uncharacterized protein n=1 Tax=Tritonibacter mobilis F1926 TaxID=1265309 RepID=A0A1B1A8Q0_9RHOB|nr:hypothetical protein [Tritonibacter mobilis]ANP42933.1 hypothetical protein K529_019405 [Tritonibacter mobilis F1926]KJZ23255.1 hypothetical protein TW79_13200 [Tritonibacter mobilis]